jgi:4-alpha-glucanotransferase
MWEFQFAAAAGGDAALHPPERPLVAGCNTHDMATFRAFWTGADITELAALGMIADEGAARAARTEQIAALAESLGGALGTAPPTDADVGLDAALTVLARSSAEVVMVSLEDLWGEACAQNVPGTGSAERANWRQRTAISLEDLATSDGVARRAQIAAEGRSGTVQG